MGKLALIAGATGLVGKELLQLLIQKSEYEKVISLVRNPSGIKHSKLTEVIVDFDRLEEARELFKVNDVFCCLGTTIKKAKTTEAMYRVDVQYPLKIAKLAKEEGSEQYAVVSSIGANLESKAWYLKIKGELEEQLKAVGYRSLYIFRPSLLLGIREEFRLGERVASVIYPLLSPIMLGSLKKYRAIEAKTVAAGMFNAMKDDSTGLRIYSSDQIELLGRK